MSTANTEQNLPPKLQIEINKVKGWVSDPVLLSAVQMQNKTKVSLQEIQKKDQEWIRGTISSGFVKSVQENACGIRLREVQKNVPSVMEAFVMDSQGALVCATQKTSDYWQGDEDKWKIPFNERRTWIGKREYDESTKSTLMHVSVPIHDQNSVIGVICAGINLARLAEGSTP